MKMFNYSPYQCSTFGCHKAGQYWLHDDKGKRIPGGPFCFGHATAAVTEYLEKLCEEWSMRWLAGEERGL